MLEQGPAVLTKENVLIRSGACSVTVLPTLGGKISSISIHGQELLQAPLAPLAARTHTMPFDASDASGWDECLPSVAAATVATSDGRLHHVPDHGDLWRVAWQQAETQACDQPLPNGDSKSSKACAAVSLRGQCFSLPLVLERTLALSQEVDGWALKLHYKLTNVGTSTTPWSWAAHPLFAVESGDRILLPDSVRTLRLEGSGGNRLGRAGATVNWPIATLTGGGETDLSVARSSDSGVGDKLFAGPIQKHENWCALERPSAGIRIRVRFDADATPYLGLWICYGGWPDRVGPKQTCVAMEPATAPVDSLAHTGPWTRRLSPGQSSEWTMHVDFELI